MKIDSQTKISAIIRHNSEAIGAIAAINPHFNKLRNPILRRVLTPRVTVADAARIGRCEARTILDALHAIGFEVDAAPGREPAGAPAPDYRAPIMAAVGAGKVCSLDVRPILEGGDDPFQRIMTELKTLPAGYALEVVNTFEPTPLIKILRKKGYGSFTREEAAIVHTWFLKTGEVEEAGPERTWLFRASPEKLDELKAGFGGRCREVDVRDLEMPLPLVTILNELEDLPAGHALFVHHKKTPQYLLPELEERGCRVWIADRGEGNVKLLIHR